MSSPGVSVASLTATVPLVIGDKLVPTFINTASCVSVPILNSDDLTRSFTLLDGVPGSAQYNAFES